MIGGTTERANEPGVCASGPLRVNEMPSLDSGRETYRAVGSVLAPRWMRLLGPSPWFHDDSVAGGLQNYYRASAVLALGLYCELAAQRPESSYQRECVRAGLVRWQFLLGRDGRPRSRAARRDPMTGAAAAQVVRLLAEATSFQTATLLDDLALHLHWLARGNERYCWIEAVTVSALCDGATLVRDAKLLQAARQRLAGLLARQDEEGWFPGEHGVELSRCSAMVDSLGRVWCEHEWPELEAPLQRTLQFGLALAGRNAVDLAMTLGPAGPYGVELLSSNSPQAATIARKCREALAALDASAAALLGDGACAELGVSAMLAAMYAPARLPKPIDEADDGSVRFPRAGVWLERTSAYRAVVAARRGGSMSVRWRDGSVMNDTGVVVVLPLGIKSSGLASGVGEVRFAATSVLMRGILRRVAGTGERRTRRWFPFWRRPAADTISQGEHGFHPHLVDHFEREITFGDDSITLRDRVDCLLPCVAIVLESPAPWSADGEGVAPPGGPPMFLEGGRHVEITRVYQRGQLVERRVRRLARGEDRSEH